MTVLRIKHRTEYRFESTVGLNPHRLLLRPREGRDLRLLSHDLQITPSCEITWAQDVFGNAVAVARFTAMTDNLVFESVAEVELTSSAWPVFPIAASAISYPFRYSDEEWTDLGALATPQYLNGGDALRKWARSFVLGSTTDTLSLLKDLNQGVTQWIRYEARDAEGTHSPDETLQLGIGTCRDMATLSVEAARILGFGSRIVSGYLYDPDMSRVGSAGSGSTHAWAEVYVPGAGWITFDPTNRSVGGHNLIPVAVARDIRQVMPVSGSYLGSTYSKMTVEVTVSAN
ncbi:transglutaminase family protein [Bradyrhizobium sp. 153]|uniref:transglutaminase family protein n=1 Tax=Bradyrhizobium sp. 153 TaxID=2782627 RepID=UPI001FFB3246|nr:transglutaminase family protein [Bradyrhizobium sp. 153]MCK1667730.1 transglutaminase family protein [Bradyrhizobium sp. 153]